MTKKNNTPFGSLFSPEFREVANRLKDKESELIAILQETAEEEGEKEDGEREGKTDPTEE